MIRSTPFQLEWGNSISAKVVAINLIGDSDESENGTSDPIYTLPSQVLSLRIDHTVSDLNKI